MFSFPDTSLALPFFVGIIKIKGEIVFAIRCGASAHHSYISAPDAVAVHLGTSEVKVCGKCSKMLSCAVVLKFCGLQIFLAQSAVCVVCYCVL